MTRTKRASRRAFCFLELLIVITIIAALVGMAMPFGCCLSSGSHTKAQQDLEVVNKAITLYNQREASPLEGHSLTPLLGRYMQELPNDPWGNAYLFDASLGVLASLGADALPGGTDLDRDVMVYRKPAVGAPWARELFALHPSTAEAEARQAREIEQARSKLGWF